MEIEYFRTLYDYTYWARDRVLNAAAGMSDEEYARPNGFVYGSVRGIFTHCLAAETSWLARWQGETPTPLPPEELTSVEALASRWRELEAQLRAYLASLSDADTGREVVLRRRDGSETRQPLWQLLTQVVNHATQHRSEAAEALTMVGRSPGDMDFTLYLRERSSA
jgi:uncharacterized damage-inducible protein DinB